jgi:hypothetical protein
MRIKEAASTLITNLEESHYVFDIFLKKELQNNLEVALKQYSDIGFKHIRQISTFLSKEIIIIPGASPRFSLTSVSLFFKSFYSKKTKKLKVITKHDLNDYKMFYRKLGEAITKSDLPKDHKK